jgi:hypothetical protein
MIKIAKKLEILLSFYKKSVFMRNCNKTLLNMTLTCFISNLL